MSNAPTAIVVRAAGTNCDQEMVRAFSMAGATPSLVHLDQLIRDPAALDRFDLIGFAGGFSYGDDCGAGRVQAVRVREHLLTPLREAVDRGVPVIGACNGFQVLVQTGLLPGPAEEPWDPAHQPVALAANAGARFIDDWVRVRFEPDSVCVWTRGLAEAHDLAPEAMMLPIAHGEGRFVASSERVVHALESSGQVALRYVDNVNGSEAAIAGICDVSGRVLGLMPHPERYLSWHNHPFWTRLGPAQRRGDALGLRMFKNAVAAAAPHAALR
ncbi:MAG: phosphoribosylformylglycinamidine synthase subunit PurQ [Planctomycetota bacterium]|nr:phosphoribosylformylglycinamidine synthase subunit PurQ [Planctomycetota bacterium]